MPSANSARASVHASRRWTCRCGRLVKGNGGKSSHRRACPVWQEYQADSGDRASERFDWFSRGLLVPTGRAARRDRWER